uniref:Uncharacterized protein n=2 Tax=Populus TaxID=3689 RepID=A0A4U5Q1F7_POPAL|nr:hypothetical protein D5086_0000169320 [Populus alba]
MGLRKELACLALLFLILLLLETSSAHDRSARHGSFKTTGSSTQLTGPVKSHGGGLRGDRDKEGDATLGDEKRKVYTGPNPLHNRYPGQGPTNPGDAHALGKEFPASAAWLIHGFCPNPWNCLAPGKSRTWDPRQEHTIKTQLFSVRPTSWGCQRKDDRKEISV